MSASKSTRVRTVASTGRSSDLLRPERLPVVHEQTVAGVLFRPCAEAYSSGDCPGFSPDSLLIRMAEEPFGTNSGTKIINIVMVTILRRFKNRELYYFIR